MSNREQATPRMHLIFLDKNNSNIANDWKYYRMTSIGDTLEVCSVTFPEFIDQGAPIMTPGLMGMAIASEKSTELLKHQKNIDHNRSEVIGVIIR